MNLSSKLNVSGQGLVNHTMQCKPARCPGRCSRAACLPWPEWPLGCTETVYSSSVTVLLAFRVLSQPTARQARTGARTLSCSCIDTMPDLEQDILTGACCEVCSALRAARIARVGFGLGRLARWQAQAAVSTLQPSITHELGA
jgi:hypothetical protein